MVGHHDRMAGYAGDGTSWNARIRRGLQPGGADRPGGNGYFMCFAAD